MTVTVDPHTHRYFQDGVPFNGPSVTQALAQCGIVDFRYVEEELRQEAMNRGQSVHWMTLLHDQGALNYRKLPHKLRGYRKAWVGWRASSGFVPFSQYMEYSFISELGYSGTIDRIGDFPWIDGKRTSPAVIDLKTGVLQDWVKFQLALYAHHAKVYRRIAVNLHDDGTWSVKEFPFTTFNLDFSVAYEAVRRWKKAA